MVVSSKGKRVFAIIGYGLFGLAMLSFVLRVLWNVRSGEKLWYYNVKHQPMTYLGALGMLVLLALVGLIGLYYKIKEAIEKRRAGRLSESTTE